VDYIEEYIKCVVGLDNIRVENFDVKGDWLMINYLVFYEPLFSVTNRNLNTTCNRYFRWEKMYLRKKKINKIKYDLQTTLTRTNSSR
jgi:hypothetical protein